LVLASILLVGFAFSASIKDICPDKSTGPDDFCISNNAQTVQDCQAMSAQSAFQDSCYQKVIPNTQNCSDIPSQTARKDCVIYQFYRDNRNDSAACSRIQPEYEEDCYIYFVLQKSPNNLDGCDSVPSGYQVDCQKRMLRGMLGFDPQESYCSTLKEKYNSVCLQTVKEQKSFIGIVETVLASPFLCCGGVVLVAVAIAIAFYFKQKGKP
jgi:hypothetical protein